MGSPALCWIVSGNLHRSKKTPVLFTLKFTQMKQTHASFHTEIYEDEVNSSKFVPCTSMQIKQTFSLTLEIYAVKRTLILTLEIYADQTNIDSYLEILILTLEICADQTNINSYPGNLCRFQTFIHTLEICAHPTNMNIYPVNLCRSNKHQYLPWKAMQIKQTLTFTLEIYADQINSNLVLSCKSVQIKQTHPNFYPGDLCR